MFIVNNFRSSPFHDLTHRWIDSFPEHPITNSCRRPSHPCTQNAKLWNPHLIWYIIDKFTQWWPSSPGITDRFWPRGPCVQSLLRVSITDSPWDGHIGISTQSRPDGCWYVSIICQVTSLGYVIRQATQSRSCDNGLVSCI